jgi:hypothetical protein
MGGSKTANHRSSGPRGLRETGFAPASLYNLSRVESFYRHAADEVGFIPVFAAFIADPAVGCRTARYVRLAHAAARGLASQGTPGLDDIRFCSGGEMPAARGRPSLARRIIPVSTWPPGA